MWPSPSWLCGIVQPPPNLLSHCPGAATRPIPIYSPRYVIPLFGMLLGASLTAVCLGLGELMAGLHGSAGDNVEMLLAHGASRHEVQPEP